MGTEVACCCLGYVIYVFGFIALVVGLASPQWYKLEWDNTGGNEVYTGVFTTCYESSIIGDDCGRVKLEDAADWWQGAAALLLVALLLGLIAGFTAMYVPVTSTLQIFAGLIGGAGSIVFGVKVDEIEQDWDDFFSLSGLLDTDWKFMWGFYLALGGSCVLFLNGFGLAIMSCCYGCSMRPICCCCGGRRHSRDPYGRSKPHGGRDPYGSRGGHGRHPSSGRQHQMSQYPNQYAYGGSGGRGHAYPY